MLESRHRSQAAVEAAIEEAGRARRRSIGRFRDSLDLATTVSCHWSEKAHGRGYIEPGSVSFFLTTLAFLTGYPSGWHRLQGAKDATT